MDKKSGRLYRCLMLALSFSIWLCASVLRKHSPGARRPGLPRRMVCAAHHPQCPECNGHLPRCVILPRPVYLSQCKVLSQNKGQLFCGCIFSLLFDRCFFILSSNSNISRCILLKYCHIPQTDTNKMNEKLNFMVVAESCAGQRFVISTPN